MSQVQQLLTEHLDIWTAAETEKKSGRGRASGTAGKVYGIQKLRGLILDLAVRGKLVPQDPNDEPASELLKRIQAEKAKLIAEGKLKKEKPLEAIAEDEKPFDLHKGWEWVRNCELFQLRKGRIPKSLNEDGLGLPYLDIDALDRNILRRYSEESTCPQSTDKDILVVCDGSRSGLVLDGQNGIIGSTLSIIDTPLYIQNYIKLIFKQGFEIFNTSMKGAAIPHLDTQKLLQNPTALPPLDEQQRIVAKVDELMALCDQLEQQHSNAAEAHEKLVEHLLGTLNQAQNAQEFNSQWQRIYAHFDTLFTTEASIDALKKILLQLAVMGKLVPQDPADEPASELLKRIQAEKAKLIAEGKLKKEKPLAPITDEEKSFELPKGWECKRLGELVTFEYGDNLPEPKRTNTGEYPVYGSNGIVGTHKQSFVNSKCIVIGRKGSAGALNLSLSNGCCVTDVAYYCIPPSELDLFFTFKLFHTLGLDELGKGIKPGLNRNEAYNLILAIPPVNEQRRIVAKVDELMALCDQLKTRIQQASQYQQQLADVLVAQAVA